MNNIHGSHKVWNRRQKSKIHKRHDQEELTETCGIIKMRSRNDASWKTTITALQFN